jgi:hypothetical protein
MRPCLLRGHERRRIGFQRAGGAFDSQWLVCAEGLVPGPGERSTRTDAVAYAVASLETSSSAAAPADTDAGTDTNRARDALASGLVAAG